MGRHSMARSHLTHRARHAAPRRRPAHAAQASRGVQVGVRRNVTTYCAAATAVAAVCLATLHATGTGSTRTVGSLDAMSVRSVPTSVERKAAGLSVRLGCRNFTGQGTPLDRPLGAIAFACTGSVAKHTQWDAQFLAAFDRKAKPPAGLAPTFAVIVVFTSPAARIAMTAQDVAAHTLASTDPAAVQLSALDPTSPDIVGQDWLLSGNDANARIAAVRLGGVLQAR